MKHWLIINENSDAAFRLKDLLEKEDRQAIVHMAHTGGNIYKILDLFAVELVFVTVSEWDGQAFIGKNLRFVFLVGGRDFLKEELTSQQLLYLRDEPYKMKDVILLMIKLENTPYLESIDFMFVRSERRIRRVFYSDIQLIERKDSAYSQLHTKQGKLMILRGLNAWKDVLPKEKFKRVADQLILPVGEEKNIAENCYRFEGRDIYLTYKNLVRGGKSQFRKNEG